MAVLEKAAVAPVTPSAHVRVLDGMRGIAILLVVLLHHWQLSWFALKIPGLPDRFTLEFAQGAGYVGVELFFFISAFCLFHPHARAMLGSGPVPTLRHYAYRRAIKILPSYLLAVLVFGTVLVSSPLGARIGWPADLGLHLVFLHNLLPETIGSLGPVFWSLAVEVQFYVLFPLLARAARRRPWLTVAAMVAAAIAYRAWARSQPFGRFAFVDSMMPAFLDLFAMGMLAAYLVVWIRARPAADVRRLRGAFTVLAAGGAVALLMLLEWAFDLRFEAALPEVWRSHNRTWLAAAFLGVAVASVFAANLWQRLLANPVLVFLSTISYNLYLWHYGIARLIREERWVPSVTAEPTQDPQWQLTFTLVGIAASVVVATLVTYGFERPLLRLGVRGAVRSVRARLAGSEGEDLLVQVPAGEPGVVQRGPDGLRQPR